MELINVNYEFLKNEKESKTHFLPEWYLINKSLKKYNYKKLENVIFEEFGEIELTKEQLKIGVKKLKKETKEKEKLNINSENSRYELFDSKVRKGDKDSLDLKIKYIEILNDKEKDRRLNLDKKSEALISRSSIIISILTALGAFGSNSLMLTNNSQKFIIFLFILLILVLLGFISSIIIAYFTLKPKKYSIMLPNIILKHNTDDLRHQKSDYLKILFKNVNEVINVNRKRGDILNIAFVVFIISMALLVIFLIFYIYIVMLKNNILVS